MPRIMALFLVLLLTATTTAADNRMSPELLWKLGRVGGGVISPDGKQVAYTVRRYDLSANSGASEIRVASLDGKQDRLIATVKGKSVLLRFSIGIKEL